MKITRRLVAISLLGFCASGAGFAYFTHKHAIEQEEACLQAAAYEQASSLEEDGHAQAAYQLFGDFLCEGVFFTPPAGHEHPCARAAKLGTQIELAHKETVTELTKYRELHGAYPASLDEISGALSQPTRQVVQGFTYLRTSGAQMSIATGQYGEKLFTLSQTPNPSIEGMHKRLRLLCTPHVKR